MLRRHGGARVVLAAYRGELCCGLVALDVHASRRLFGSKLIRVRRFCSTFAPEVTAALGRGLTMLGARVHARVILLTASATEAMHVNQTITALNSVGFLPQRHSATSAHTALVDLAGGDVAVLHRFSRSTRRHLRGLATAPVEFRPVTDEGLAPRIKALKESTLARHGGNPNSFPLDYAAMISAANSAPNAFSLMGAFLTGRAGAEALVAWEFTTFDGVRALSEHAAMEQSILNDRTMPLGYGTLWASMRWAMARGARVFDLGGITVAGDTNHNAFASISQFKTGFGGAIVSGLEQECLFEPDTVPARLQRAAVRLGSLASPWK